MAKKKSPRKRPPVPTTASKALSQLAEQPRQNAAPRGESQSGPRSKSESGVFEELYASELRRRAEAVKAVEEGGEAGQVLAESETPAIALQVMPKELASGPQLSAKARGIEETKAEKKAAEELADDTSIPPVDVEAEQFFAEGESRASMPHLWGGGDEHEEDLVEHEPHSDHVRRASPEVLARRARLRKVTQRVVGAFALIALVGLGKAALTRAPSADLPIQSTVAHAAAALPQREQPAPARDEKPVQAEAPKAPAAEVRLPAAGPAAAPPADPTPAAAPPAKPAEEAKPEAAKAAVEAAPAAPTPTGDAKADKRAAQRAIERGDNKGAVEAGERAIEADPDAETYLIVGAAYQQMGQNGKARQVFAACASKATHGPRGECAALR